MQWYTYVRTDATGKVCKTCRRSAGRKHDEKRRQEAKDAVRLGQAGL